mgnify:CR=1 FL=1
MIDRDYRGCSLQLWPLIHQTKALTVLAGDFSRNSATAAALSNAIREAIENGVASPLLVMRDSVDLLSADASILLGHPKLILIASMAQLQRIFRAVYYPRMLMLSQNQPIIPL